MPRLHPSVVSPALHRLRPRSDITGEQWCQDTSFKGFITWSYLQDIWKLFWAEYYFPIMANTIIWAVSLTAEFTQQSNILLLQQTWIIATLWYFSTIKMCLFWPVSLTLCRPRLVSAQYSRLGLISWSLCPVFMSRWNCAMRDQNTAAGDQWREENQEVSTTDSTIKQEFSAGCGCSPHQQPVCLRNTRIFILM